MQIYVRRWVVCSLGQSHQKVPLREVFVAMGIRSQWDNGDGNNFVVTWMAMCEISVSMKVAIGLVFV